MRIFRSILEDLKNGENLDVYLAIPIAIIVAILGLFGVAGIPIIAATILAVSALTTTSLLTNRKITTDLIETTKNLNAELIKLKSEFHHVDESTFLFSREYPDFVKDIRTARKIGIVGMSLFKTTSNYYAEFEKALKNGANLRTITSEVSPEIISMLIFRSYMISEPSHMTEVLNNHLKLMSKLKTCAVSPSHCQSRVIPFVVPFGLVIIEDANGIGKVYVKIMTFRAPPGNYPVLNIYKEKHRDWYDYFSEQFEILWNASNEIV